MNYLLFLQNIRLHLEGSLDSFFLFLTGLSESPWPYLFLAWIYWCENKQTGVLMGLSTGINCGISQTIKHIFNIERPWIKDERIMPVTEALAKSQDPSFPSGHTVRSGSAYGVFGAEVFGNKEGNANNKPAGITLILFFLLIAFSRNWLGVHTIEDVLAGIAIVLCDYLILKRLLIWSENGNSRDTIVCILVCFIFALPIYKFGLLPNIGSCFGFYFGWLIERHFIKFEIPDTLEKRIARVVPGFIGILFISKAFQNCLYLCLRNRFASFFAAFLLSFFIMSIYPALFTFKGKKRFLLLLFTSIVILFPFGILLTKGDESEIVPEKQIMVIGHRGFASAAPENTMPSFEKAIEIEPDYIELDVQMSADRQIVVCHDSNLQRLTGKDVELASLTLAELKKLDVGKWFSDEYTGLSMPSLSEVFDLVKDHDIKIYLELKDIGEDYRFAKDVYDLTNAFGMKDRCVFASFRYDYLLYIKNLDHNTKILLNTNASETTLPSDFPSDFYGINYNSLSAELVEEIHKRGSKVFVWTVDEEQQIKEELSKDVDGICSNYPERVQDILNKR